MVLFSRTSLVKTVSLEMVHQWYVFILSFVYLPWLNLLQQNSSDLGFKFFIFPGDNRPTCSIQVDLVSVGQLSLYACQVLAEESQDGERKHWECIQFYNSHKHICMVFQLSFGWFSKIKKSCYSHFNEYCVCFVHSLYNSLQL